MVDLHCHILPGFAGGPINLEASLQLALNAEAHGVQAMVATPHFVDGDYRTQWQLATSVGEALIGQLRTRGALIEIKIAAECRIGQRLARAIVLNQAPVLGEYEGMRVLMTQLPDSRIPKNIVSIIEWMASQNIRPLLACPELHREVLKDIEILAPMITAGALLEVNAAALAGRHGPYAQKRSRQLLERGWAKLMSSNARAGDAAGALLEVGREAAAAIIGEHAAQDLVWMNPARMVAPHLLGRGKG